MPSDYAARYRAARAFADLSQEALAEKLGVDAQTIKRREAGTKDPKKGERIAVAAICGVPQEFMESGWGALRPDEVRQLLLDQTELLAEIREAVREERAIKAQLDGLLPGVLGLIRPAAKSTPAEALPPSGDAQT